MFMPIVFIRPVSIGGYSFPYEPRKRVLPDLEVSAHRIRSYARNIHYRIVQMGDWDVAVDRITDMEIVKARRS